MTCSDKSGAAQETYKSALSEGQPARREQESERCVGIAKPAMMKLEMATTLTTAELQDALEDPTLNVILIDCRSFMDYNSCHITNAHNVHFPPIVKRRSGGSIPLDNIIRCVQTRTLLLDGHFDLVVVYDDSTRSLDELARDSVTHLVLKSLKEDADIRPLYLAEGECFHPFFLAPLLCLCRCFVKAAK